MGKADNIKKKAHFINYKECKIDTNELVNKVLELCCKGEEYIEQLPYSRVMMDDLQTQIYFDIKKNNRSLSYIETNYDFKRSEIEIDFEAVRDMYLEILRDREVLDKIQTYLSKVNITRNKNELVKDLIEDLEKTIEIEETSKSSFVNLNFFEKECNEFQRAHDYVNDVALPLGIDYYDKGKRRFNFPQSLGMVLLTTGSGKCISGDTLIPTNKGIFPIEELAKGLNSGEYKDLKLKIYGVNGIDETSTIYNNGLSNVVKITTEYGYELIGTYQHRVYDGKKWCFLPHLKIGDKLPLIKGLNLWNEDKKLNDVNINELSNLDKIPLDVFLSSKNSICSYLSLLFEFSGEFYINENNGEISLHYITKYELLAKQIHFLFLHLGIISQKINRKNEFEIIIKNYNNILIFHKHINLIFNSNNCYIKKYLNNNINYKSKNNIVEYFYDKIIKIEYDKSITYDFVVPKTHSFVGNGFINHNTHLMCIMSKANIEAGHKVLFLRGEMTRGEINERLLPHLTDGKITKKMIREGQIEKYKEIREEIYEKYKDLLYVVGPEHFGGIMKLSVIRNLIRQIGPRVVIIDYLQLIEGVEDYTKPITQDLKNFCDLYNVNIIVAAQANNLAKYDPSGDGYPDIRHIEKCKSLVNSCDWLMAAKTEQREDIGGLIYHFVVRKNRQGGLAGICNKPYLLLPDSGYFGRSEKSNII